MLFGSYRRGDANDPDAYVAAITAVLSIYDTDLMREVTDPRSGIQTSEKYMSFMPNAGELKVYCDGVANRRANIERLGSWQTPKPVAYLAPPPPRPGDLANLFVPAADRRYARLEEWSKTGDQRLFRFDDKRGGIWIALNVFDSGTARPRVDTWKRPDVVTLSEEAIAATDIVPPAREDVA